MTYDCRSILKHVLKCYSIFPDVHNTRKLCHGPVVGHCRMRQKSYLVNWPLWKQANFFRYHVQKCRQCQKWQIWQNWRMWENFAKSSILAIYDISDISGLFLSSFYRQSQLEWQKTQGMTSWR